MRTEKVIRYHCSFCSRGHWKSSPCQAHERRCFHNPVRQACQTCRYLTKDRETVYNPYHGGNPGSADYEVKTQYCTALGLDFSKQDKRCDCPKWEALHVKG